MDTKRLVDIFIKANLTGIVAGILGYALAPEGLLFAFGFVWMFIAINAGLIIGAIQIKEVIK